MEVLYKVKDHKSLRRSSESKGIINVDNQEYFRYISQKDEALREKNKLQQACNEINNIKQELNDIKSLLYRILETQNANNK